MKGRSNMKRVKLAVNKMSKYETSADINYAYQYYKIMSKLAPYMITIRFDYNGYHHATFEVKEGEIDDALVDSFKGLQYKSSAWKVTPSIIYSHSRIFNQKYIEPALNLLKYCLVSKENVFNVQSNIICPFISELSKSNPRFKDVERFEDIVLYSICYYLTIQHKNKELYSIKDATMDVEYLRSHLIALMEKNYWTAIKYIGSDYYSETSKIFENFIMNRFKEIINI